MEEISTKRSMPIVSIWRTYVCQL